jgi:hypothetical protein
MEPRRASALITFLWLATLLSWAQGNSGATSPADQNAGNLDPVIGQIRQATQSANADITRLQIDRWKSDSGTKQQMQQVAESLKKNLTFAVPDLITDVQTNHGSVSSTFRLYHNLNVVYEFLSSLADAAGAFGKKDEYEALSKDVSSLDNARQGLSGYIEQAAARLEKPKPAPVTVTPSPTPRRIVVDDTTPTPRPSARKKKTSASPSPTPKSTP